MSGAQAIARAFRGKPYGSGWIISCPAADHGKGRGDKNRSCTVKDGDVFGRILVHCFAGCPNDAVLDGLRAFGLLESESVLQKGYSERRELPKPSEPEPNLKAVAIWKTAHPITGTPAEIYLRAMRRIEMDWLPSLRFGRAKHPVTGLELPAMIVAIARPSDRRVVAVQATFLTEAGRKSPLTKPRATFGALGTGAVRLAAADKVLGLAEGTETALSAMQLTGIPCWSAVGAARLDKITLPASVRQIHLFADNDEPGRKAAKRAADRYASTGLKVFVRFPPAVFNDYSDMLMAQTGGAAA